MNGTWTGSGHQTGGGLEPSSYQVVMRIAAGGGSIDYPSLSCGGSLTALSAEGDAAQFKEHITYGNCADGGTIDVKLNGGKLDWKWSGLEDMIVTALLESACTVTDPTGTPLNVRDSPNGKITGMLANGLPVSIVDSKTAANGKPWVKIGIPGHRSRSVGCSRNSSPAPRARPHRFLNAGLRFSMKAAMPSF